MERTLISWSVPNMITIWLMLLIGLFVLALVMQVGFRWLGGQRSNPENANNAGGY